MNNTFKHRFDQTKATELLDVVNSINNSVRKAESILHLLSVQLTENEERLNNSLLANSIDAVLDELLDIDAVIDAHFEASKTKKSNTINTPQNVVMAREDVTKDMVVARIHEFADMIEQNGLTTE